MMDDGVYRFTKEVYAKFRRGDSLSDVELNVLHALFEQLCDLIGPLGRDYYVVARSFRQDFIALDGYKWARKSYKQETVAPAG